MINSKIITTLLTCQSLASSFFQGEMALKASRSTLSNHTAGTDSKANFPPIPPTHLTNRDNKYTVKPRTLCSMRGLETNTYT